MVASSVLDRRLVTPRPRAERRALDARYLAFVAERDGAPDLPRRTLARREAWFQALAASPLPAWDGERIPQDQFERWHRGLQPLAGASSLAIWLVAVARANEGEEWGVDYLLARGGFQGLGRGGRALKPRDFADLEETYHTRIFREIVRLFGLSFELREPPRPVQQSVKLMARLPERLSLLLLAAGELMGTVSFLRMAEWGDRLLRGHPAVAARVRDLFDEILIDEVGHVTYLLGSMTGPELALVGRLARLYFTGTRRGYKHQPPGEAEVILRGIEDYSLAQFPVRVLRRAFVPPAYWPTEVAGPLPAATAVTEAPAR
jgi:hypothetical protein